MMGCQRGQACVFNILLQPKCTAMTRIGNEMSLAQMLTAYRAESAKSSRGKALQTSGGQLQAKSTTFKIKSHQQPARTQAKNDLSASIDRFAEQNHLTNEQANLLKNAIQPGFEKSEYLSTQHIKVFFNRLETSSDGVSLDAKLLDFIHQLTDAKEIDVLTQVINTRIAEAGMTIPQIKQFGEQVADRVQQFRQLDIVQQNPDVFTSEVVYRLAAGEDCSDLKLDLKIPADGGALGNADHLQYVELQSKIAETISDEYKRPVIELEIKGSAAPATSLGIVGGTGPLSDAAMVKLTMGKLQDREGFDLQQVHIRLLSAPPPRGVPRKGGGGPSYAARTAAFTSKNHSALVLASNTAHENISKLKAATFATHDFEQIALRSAGVPTFRATPRVHDLVDKIVDHVENTDDARPLVLGTSQAYDSNLYPGRFSKRDIESCIVRPGTEAWISNPDRQQEKTALRGIRELNHITLQAFIDFAKSHGEDAELKQDLIRLITQEVQRHNGDGNNPTHVILGCTELPLALGHDGIHQLQHELGIEFIDTEEFFATEYAQLVVDNAN